MAKQSAGYMGGFSGRLGPAVGYMWRGVWCVRSHQPVVHNPRTPAQTAHREMFKREVQLAAQMRWAVNLGFRDLSYDNGMTPYNLFVHLNQHAFSLEDGVFTVDYSRLRLSSGPRAAVAFREAEWTSDNVLTASFDKDDGSGLKASAFDSVYLYVYCPDLEEGFLAAPVYRRTRRVSVALPDGFAGREVHLYGMAVSDDGQWSETVYAGCLNGESELCQRDAGGPGVESPVGAAYISRGCQPTEWDTTSTDEPRRGGTGEPLADNDCAAPTWLPPLAVQ